jgi:hypothetical protein
VRLRLPSRLLDLAGELSARLLPSGAERVKWTHPVERCVEPALWRPCAVVRAPRRADGASGGTGAGAGGNGRGATEEVVVTLPACGGHAESVVSAYVHVGFGRAVTTWV